MSGLIIVVFFVLLAVVVVIAIGVAIYRTRKKILAGNYKVGGTVAVALSEGELTWGHAANQRPWVDRHRCHLYSSYRRYRRGRIAFCNCRLRFILSCTQVDFGWPKSVERTMLSFSALNLNIDLFATECSLGTNFAGEFVAARPSIPCHRSLDM